MTKNVNRENTAIKVIILVLIALLFTLIPIKALAASPPSTTVSSTLSECYEGEVTTIIINIYNDTGVDILPTHYFLDGSYYSINSTFMSPGQSLTIKKNYTVYFNGAQSVDYPILLVYHEDNQPDSYVSAGRAVIKKKAMQVITAAPMQIITPMPTATFMGVITPQPTSMSVITPQPTSMSVITPTPDNGIGNISVITPAPSNMPQSTPAPAIENDDNQPKSTADDAPIALMADETDMSATDEKEQSENQVLTQEDSPSYAGVNAKSAAKYINDLLFNLDGITIICLAIIMILVLGYIILGITIKIKKSKNH